MTRYLKLLIREAISNFRFQDTCLGMIMAFEIQYQPFVQILHDGHGHWLTISSIGGKPRNTDISIYGSMYPSVGSYTKKQIAAIQLGVWTT